MFRRGHVSIAVLMAAVGCSPTPPAAAPSPVARTLTLAIDPESFPLSRFKDFTFRGALRCDSAEDAAITGHIYVSLFSVSGEGGRLIELVPIRRERPGVFTFSHVYKGYQLHFPTGQVRIFGSFGDPPNNVTTTAYFDFDPDKVKPDEAQSSP